MDLISWRNPNANDTSQPHLNYDDYNLIFDIPHEGQNRSKNVESTTPKSSKQEMAKPTFSIVKHWPPEWSKDNDRNN